MTKVWLVCLVQLDKFNTGQGRWIQITTHFYKTTIKVLGHQDNLQVLSTERMHLQSPHQQTID